MTPDPDVASRPTPLAPGTPAGFPAWFPAWAVQLADLSFSGTTSVFLLHGNTNDLVRRGAAADEGFGTIPEFLAEQMFGRWDLVLHYDLGRGLRAFAGRNEKRLQKMVALANERVGGPERAQERSRPDPARCSTSSSAGTSSRRPSGRSACAVLIDQASFLFPTGEPGRTSFAASAMLVTLLNWAKSPHIKKMPVAFVLIDEKRSDLSERLTGSPHVASIEVPLPAEEERARFVRVHAVGPGTWRRSRTSTCRRWRT